MIKFQKIFLILLFITLSTQAIATASPSYFIIIDGGSTGSRLFLFYCTREAHSNNLAISLKKKVSKKIPVTDASVIAQPQDYFNDLFRSLETGYPLSTAQRTQTPIYFMATAGVRSLPIEQQNKVIDAVRTGLMASMQQQGYKLPTSVENQIRIISGSEEGLFGWLSIQYWNNALKQNVLTANNTEPLLEMGGSSTQIAFLSNTLPQEYAQNYQHGKTIYHPYVYSYANFGLNAAMENMLALFKQGAEDFAACFPSNAPYPLKSPILNGTGNFAQCSQFIRTVIYKENTCDECSKMGVYQPQFPTNQAMLTSGYIYTFNVLGLAHQWIPLKNLAIQGAAFCAKPWDQMQTEFPKESAEYLVAYCFNAAWADSLLRGYGLNDDTQLLATDSINNVKDSTEWATGAVWYLLH